MIAASANVILATLPGASNSVTNDSLLTETQTLTSGNLARGILEAIDMDSYRVEKKAALHIILANQNAEIDPIMIGGGGIKPEPELDRLSNILTDIPYGSKPWLPQTKRSAFYVQAYRFGRIKAY